MWPNGNRKNPTSNAKLRSQGRAQIVSAKRRSGGTERIVHQKRWREGTAQTVRAQLRSGEKVQSAAEMSNEVKDGQMWRDGMKEEMRKAAEVRVILTNATQTIAEIVAGEI
jgi:hypothetical protein